MSPSRDPIGYDGGSSSIYEFVSCSPLLHLDPSGLQSDSIFGGSQTVSMTVTIKDGSGWAIGDVSSGGFSIDAVGDCDDSNVSSAWRGRFLCLARHITFNKAVENTHSDYS